MNNLSMFCLSMEPSHLNTIKEFGYLPVGLGENNFGKGAGISKSDLRANAIAPKKKNSIRGLKAFWMKRFCPISSKLLNNQSD